MGLPSPNHDPPVSDACVTPRTRDIRIMDQRQLKVSVNTQLIDKIKPANKLAYSHGFQTGEFTVEDLAEVINMGYAISYLYVDGIRKSENFLSTDFLAVDIDGGRTIHESLGDPIVEKYCSILYKTPSHSPEQHRFRLVFVLPRTVTDINELKAAARSLGRRLGGDPSVTDGARMFYGSRYSDPLIFEKSITDEFLSELIEDGKVIPASDSIANHSPVASRSQLRLDRDMTVRTSDNQNIELQNIKGTHSVYCPFHNDRNPSAFVSVNKQESIYLHCSSCQMTWWMKGVDQPLYDFNGFEKLVRSIKDGSIKTSNDVRTPFQEFFYIQTLSPRNIQISSGQFLTLNKIKPGLTLIKSPKGTGKTTFLARVMQKIIYKYATLKELEENSDSDEEDESYFTEERILLIGHRQALIGDLCQRLNLNCYLDDPKEKNKWHEILHRQARYGICLDSLWRIENEKYDIIIIDEVEQVLNHFMSDTIGESRNRIFTLFTRLLQQAKKIVVLDADLGWISFNTLTALTNEYNSTPSAGAKNKTTKRAPIHIYLNDWIPPKKTLNIYPTDSQLIQHIKESIVGGKRVFVSSNSKAKIKNLAKAVEDLAKQTGNPISAVTITSENSRSKEIQKFITNIKSEILKYQVIMSSPSLGTGIDITFENDKQEIDCVYGLFENQINSHLEIDQQLARVRNPKEVHVWVSPARFNFETDFDVVNQDILRENLIDTIVSGYIKKGVVSPPDQINPFLYMASMLTTHQRASKNNLKSNFIKYKQEQGWTVLMAEADKLLAKEGNALYMAGKLLNAQETVNNIVGAKTMTQYEYEQFLERVESNDGIASPDEWYSFYRTRLELFYGVIVDDAVVERENKHNFIGKIPLFESIRSKPSHKYESDVRGGTSKIKKEVKIRLKLFKDRSSAALLLYELLSETPIFNDGVFDANVTFTKDDLNNFSKMALKLKPYIETQLEVPIRSDVDKKSVQQLGSLIKHLGLELEVVNQTKKKGIKIYRYKLRQQNLDEILEISNRRSQLGLTGWTYVNDIHNFKYSDNELDWIERRDSRRY